MILFRCSMFDVRRSLHRLEPDGPALIILMPALFLGGLGETLGGEVGELITVGKQGGMEGGGVPLEEIHSLLVPSSSLAGGRLVGTGAHAENEGGLAKLGVRGGAILTEADEVGPLDGILVTTGADAYGGIDLGGGDEDGLDGLGEELVGGVHGIVC